MKKTVLAVALLLPFVSAMHAESADTNNDSNKPKGSPTIKGLFLGMKGSDAIEVLKKLDNEPTLEIARHRMVSGQCICKHLTYEQIKNSIFARQANPFEPVDPITVVDENGYVIKITFSGYKTSELFGTKALGADEFAKKVMDSYNIPDLKPNEQGNGWKYVNENGWSIKIDQNHLIELSKEDMVKKMD
jgi:hypothetical protein